MSKNRRGRVKLERKWDTQRRSQFYVLVWDLIEGEGSGEVKWWTSD